MVQGGNQIEDEQGEPVNAITHDRARIASHRRKGHEHGATGEREGRADQMSDAVEAFAFMHVPDMCTQVQEGGNGMTFRPEGASRNRCTSSS
jgi:acetyl-CoA carboxylase alpha subunit